MMSLRRTLVALLLHRSPGQRRKASRGQALVEFALFVPLFMGMLIGATDISTLLDDHLNVVYAARAGARVGSVIGNFVPNGVASTADCAIIGAVQAALQGDRNVQVSQIVIYEADANGQPVSSALEDVYPGNAICNSNGTITPSATQLGWMPSGTTTPPSPPKRDNTPFTEESLGVAITYTYTFAFNPLGGTTVGPFTDSAVMPIEIVVNTQ